MIKLKFINHASYIVETDNSILLHDPWYEGNAFNNGWSLLSKDICNQDIINYLLNSNKSINIWISHEHSDHFSVPFIKALKTARLDCLFFFHNTTDKRVLKFLKANNFRVIECIEGKEYKLEDNFFLSTYYYAGGDSFCFLRTNAKNILNINDCVIRDEKQAHSVLSRLPKHASIDILFTQYGYANWIGRPEDILLRKKSAEEKFSRMLIQNNAFNPKMIIPFASFVYFCKEDNFYLNDEQNTPEKLRRSQALLDIQEKINFMKPNQEVLLDNNLLKNLQHKTVEAESYWNNLEREVKQLDKSKLSKVSESLSEDELIKLGAKYISSVRHQTIGFVSIFELIGIFKLKPINFHIYDLNINLNLSYITGITSNDSQDADLSIHSSELAFVLKNEFGWNTLSVSGAFRSIREDVNGVSAFFRWQDAIKNGFSFNHPIHIIRVVSRFIYKNIFT